MKRFLKALIRPGEDGVFGQAMSAGFWVTALRVVLRLAIIVRTVILANLLAPGDFGIMAVATISILLLEKFTESGFSAALVQRTDAIEPYLNSAWTMQIVRGIAIGGILALGAPLIAGFFKAPEAEPVIQVLALTVVFSGFDNIAAVMFIKDLRFDKYFILQVSKTGTDVVVSIAAAFVFRNVWALVLGSIAGSVGRLAMSYVIHPYRPRVRWTWEQVRILFSFGKWITVSQIVNFLTMEIDDILLGRLRGVADLGIYRMAYNFSQAVATEIGSVTSQVAFPTYSRLQTQPEKLRSAYLGTVHLVAFLGFPLAIGTILVAPDLVLGLLGEKWEAVIVPLQILSLSGLVRGVSGTIGPLMQSQGRPDIPPRFSIAKLVMLSIVLVPAINRYGINGTAWAVAIVGAMTGIPALIYSLRNVHADLGQTWQAIGMPAVNTAVMTAAVLGLTWALFPEPSALALFVLSAIGAVVYFGSAALTWRMGIYQAPQDLFARIGRVIS